jgi:hypothetical protein
MSLTTLEHNRLSDQIIDLTELFFNYQNFKVILGDTEGKDLFLGEFDYVIYDTSLSFQNKVDKRISH